MAKSNIDWWAEGRKRKKIRNEVGKGKDDETRNNPNTCRGRTGKYGEKQLRAGNKCNTEKMLQITAPNL